MKKFKSKLKNFYQRLKDFDPALFDKSIETFDKINDLFVKIQDKLAVAIDKMASAFSAFILSKPIYKLYRLVSFPWHFIAILIYKLYKKLKSRGILIYDRPGIHIIFGVPGSGKSSLSYELIERIRLETKLKPSYINYPFEKHRLSEDGSYIYRYHNLYAFEDYFNYNIMRKRFNDTMFGSIVIDEAHGIFNARYNKTREYNQSFRPFIEYSTKIRQNMGQIFMLTQMGKMDIQIMMLATSITEVSIDIGFDYPDWLLETGLFRFKPLGWKITQYVIDSFGNIEHKKGRKKFYVKNEYANMDYFDSFATRGDYDHVPLDYPSSYTTVQVKG